MHHILEFWKKARTWAKTPFFSISFSIECGKQLWSNKCDERSWKADTGKHLTTWFTPSCPWQFFKCHPCMLNFCGFLDQFLSLFSLAYASFCAPHADFITEKKNLYILQLKAITVSLGQLKIFLLKKSINYREIAWSVKKNCD